MPQKQKTPRTYEEASPGVAFSPGGGIGVVLLAHAA